MFSVFAQSSPAEDEVVAHLAMFPFCQCADYKCQSNPYRLDLAGVTQVGAVTNICYLISYVSS